VLKEALLKKLGNYSIWAETS